MEPIWGRQDPGGPHVSPVNFAIWDGTELLMRTFIDVPVDNGSMETLITQFNMGTPRRIEILRLYILPVNGDQVSKKHFTQRQAGSPQKLCHQGTSFG